MRRTIILLSLLLLSLSHVWGQTEQQVKAVVDKASAQLKTMQCDFVQTKHLKLLNDRMVSTGKMYYQQHDKLRWEYMSPYQYTFIMNGQQVLLKNNGRKDVIDVNQSKAFKAIAQVMLNSVVGKCLTADKDFRSSIDISGPEYVATLQPLKKDLKSLFDKIVLHFDKQRLLVTKVELLEKKGDRTVIELKNIVTNASIPQDTFSVR
ncbi:MAG: outer membrane lipoprotein carrier protein LolA [Prevotella sp.]|nr:outer membrane lipoprotein carrier protein LolA [Prevotella sp.]